MPRILPPPALKSQFRLDDPPKISGSNARCRKSHSSIESMPNFSSPLPRKAGSLGRVLCYLVNKAARYLADELQGKVTIIFIATISLSAYRNNLRPDYNRVWHQYWFAVQFQD